MPPNRFLRRAAAPLAIASMLSFLAACGDNDEGGGGATSAPPAAKGAGAVDLSEVCPETIVVQGQWLPAVSPEGALYHLLGDSPDIDSGKKRVTAPLMAGGKATGVKLEIRAGGPAIGFQQTSAQLYQDKSTTLGVLGGFDEIIQLSKSQPTLAVTALLEKDPQMIFWDPETYPDIDSIRDLGKTDTEVSYFGGDTYMEYLTGTGILQKSQVDGSHDGSPGKFVAAGGKRASSGYAVEDPYKYEKEVKQWGKPIKFQLVYDAGYPNYGPPLVIRPDDKDKLAPCLKKLVPVVQQSQLDFLADPGPTVERIVEIADAYKGGDVFTQDIGEYSATKMKELGIAANDAEGKDETVGNFDTERVQRMIDLTEPIFADQKKPVRDGLAPDDIVTNEFVDPKIGYPAGS